MKVLFITLEQSGRQILKSLLDEKFFNTNKNQIFTFGMLDNYKNFNDITNIKIGERVYVRELLNDKYTFLHPDSTVVCQVRRARAAMVAAVDEDEDEDENEDSSENSESSASASKEENSSDKGDAPTE